MNDKIVMPSWSVCTFLVTMNTTMFNVSLPNILQELHITAALGSWVVSGYSIVFALATVIFSRLSDFVPIRTLLSIGLFLLGASSIAGFVSHSFELLLSARLMQASGAGSVAGLGIVLVTRYVPYERRGRALSMIAAGSALGFGTGPVIGGVITEFIGWNSLFLVTFLVLFLIPLLWKLLPKESGKAFNFDIPGTVLTAAAASAMLIAVTRLSILFFAVSLVALTALIRHLRKAREPFIQPVLFSHSGYRKLLLLVFILLILNMSNIFLLPLLLADGYHMAAAKIGVMIFPGALLSALLSRKVGRWIDLYGNHGFIRYGLIIIGVSIGLTTALINASPYVVLLEFLLFSPSFSMTVSAMSKEVSRIVPKDILGSGIGVFQLFQYFGGSFGAAVCGTLIALQANQPLIRVYQHIYILLFLLLLGALALFFWYLKSEGSRKSGQAERLSKLAE